jgi:hypothetical protein
MALTFPTSAAKPEFIRRGAGDIYIGAWVPAGADTPTLRHMGPTLGGIEFDPKRTLHNIIVDQFLGPVAAFPTAEDFTIKFTLLDTTLANFYKAMQYAQNTLVGGDRTDASGSLGLGEENAYTYYQIVWKGTPPPQSAASASILQFYKCVFTQVAAIKFEKEKESALQVTYTCLTDPSITTANKVGKWFSQ